MPLVIDIEAEIETKKRAIEALEAEISGLEKRRADLEAHKRLLYTGGHELEAAFARCLELLGGKISPAKYSQEEFILEYTGHHYLVECKGVAKSISLAHLRQLNDYILKYEEEENVSGKGILLGNAWKTLELKEREQAEVPVFPDNVVTRAEEFSIALVSSVAFFEAFCKFLSGQLQGEIILQELTTAKGVVKFLSD